MVLDLLMPRKDGREVLQWIRGSVETAALPVLVRTGKEGEESEAELLEAGADDYVPKERPSPSLPGPGPGRHPPGRGALIDTPTEACDF
jgi:CheY-like chemotaxis protein